MNKILEDKLNKLINQLKLILLNLEKLFMIIEKMNFM